MKRLALIGSKAFAEQIQSYVEYKEMYSVVGFFDDYEEKGTIIRKCPVLGKISEIENCYRNNIFDFVFFAAGYNNFKFRESVFSGLKGKVPFANIIDKTVFFGNNTTIGEGVYIGPYSALGNNTIVEDNVFIHGGSNIGHDNIIGRHTYISGSVQSAGFCHLGERNFVGIRVIFSDHIKTCDDVWIGIGCIVVKNIKEPGKYMSPCTKLLKIE